MPSNITHISHKALWASKHVWFATQQLAAPPVPEVRSLTSSRVHAGVTCTKCKTSCAEGQYLSGVCDGTGNADLTCLPCKNRCPEGHYMTSLCYGNSTKVCRVCMLASVCVCVCVCVHACLCTAKLYIADCVCICASANQKCHLKDLP